MVLDVTLSSADHEVLDLGPLVAEMSVEGDKSLFFFRGPGCSDSALQVEHRLPSHFYLLTH